MGAITWEDARVLYAPGSTRGGPKPSRRRLLLQRRIALGPPTVLPDKPIVSPTPRTPLKAKRPYVRRAERAAERYGRIEDQAGNLKAFYPLVVMPECALDVMGGSGYPPAAEFVLVPSWQAVFPDYQTAVRRMLFRLESVRFPGLVTPDCAWISELQQQSNTVATLASAQKSMTPVVAVDYILRLSELRQARRMMPSVLRGKNPSVRRPLGLYELVCIFLSCPRFAAHECSLDLVCWGDVVVMNGAACIPTLSIDRGSHRLRLIACDSRGNSLSPKPHERLISAEVPPLEVAGEMQLELFLASQDFGPRGAPSGTPQNTH